LPVFRRTQLTKKILTMRRSLRALDRSLRHLTPMLSTALNGGPSGNGRSRLRLSAKARASLVLQGRYMGFMRQLTLRQKAQVRKIKEVKGVRAAIRKARYLAV